MARLRYSLDRSAYDTPPATPGRAFRSPSSRCSSPEGWHCSHRSKMSKRKMPIDFMINLPRRHGAAIPAKYDMCCPPSDAWGRSIGPRSHHHVGGQPPHHLPPGKAPAHYDISLRSADRSRFLPLASIEARFSRVPNPAPVATEMRKYESILSFQMGCTSHLTRSCFIGGRSFLVPQNQ